MNAMTPAQRETLQIHTDCVSDELEGQARHGITSARVLVDGDVLDALRAALVERGTCGTCRHLDPENLGTSWGFCGAESEDYGAYPFQGQSMPLDERCKGWQAREGE